MEYTADIVVSVVGFCLALWGYRPGLQLLPLGAALIVPLYPIDAAFTAYMVVIVFGTVFELVSIGVSLAGFTERSL